MSTSIKTELLSKEPKCAICEQTFFKVERVSTDKIRLTCENCGEQHLLVITPETTKHNKLTFIAEKL